MNIFKNFFAHNSFKQMIKPESKTLIDETRVHEGGQMVHTTLVSHTSALYFDKEYWRGRSNACDMLIQALEIRLRSQDPEWIAMCNKINWEMRTVSDEEIEKWRERIKAIDKELDDSFKNNQP